MLEEQLPDWRKDNPYILSGYPPDHKSCLYYLLTIHNETLNIWLHLVPFMLPSQQPVDKPQDCMLLRSMLNSARYQPDSMLR